MRMAVPTMGPTTEFKQWKRNFLNFLSIKAAYLIPQLAIRDLGVWLDEHYVWKHNTTHTRCFSLQLARTSALTML
jgi:hypothetical protein